MCYCAKHTVVGKKHTSKEGGETQVAKKAIWISWLPPSLAHTNAWGKEKERKKGGIFKMVLGVEEAICTEGRSNRFFLFFSLHGKRVFEVKERKNPKWARGCKNFLSQVTKQKGIFVLRPVSNIPFPKLPASKHYKTEPFPCGRFSASSTVAKDMISRARAVKFYFHPWLEEQPTTSCISP